MMELSVMSGYLRTVFDHLSPLTKAMLVKTFSQDAVYKTVSGAIVSFSDGADYPLRKLIVDIDAVQDGDPWVDNVHDQTPYQFRAMAGVGVSRIGNRETDMLVGGSVAFNQTVLNGNFVSGDGGFGTKGGTLTMSDNIGTITLDGTQTGTLNYGFSNITTQTSRYENHKYFFTSDVKSDKADRFRVRLTSTTAYSPMLNAGEWGKLTAILNAVSSNIGTFTVFVEQTAQYSSGDKLYFRNMMLIDLTQMFGTTIAEYIYSLEQANAGDGVAWFKRYFPNDYYPYNAGSIESVSASAHKMTGFNQFDKNATDIKTEKYIKENGTEGSISGNNITGYIPVIPNMVYFFTHSFGSSVSRYGAWYDADKNFISTFNLPYNGGSVSHVQTSPSNARYVRASVANTYWDNYCINLHWDGERDGEYEEYKEWVYPLDSDIALRGIPKLDSDNNLIYDGDTYESDGTVTRRYKYDIFDGSNDESWSLQSINDAGIANFFVSLTDYVGDDVNRCVVNKLNPQTSVIGSTTTEGYYLNSAKSFFIRIKSTTASTVAEFRTWLANNNIEIVYELATPTTETADTFTNPQIVDNWGTEEYVTTSVVPVGHDSTYSHVADITGWDGAKIFVSPTVDEEDATVYDVSWQSEAGTVYGGKLNVTTGELVVDKICSDLGDLTWDYNGTRFRAETRLRKHSSQRLVGICSHYPLFNGMVVNAPDKSLIMGTEAAPSSPFIYVKDSSYSDAETFTTAMDGVQLVYELATPQTVQLTPTEVKSLLGQNNIWADSGDVDVTYRAI